MSVEAMPESSVVVPVFDPREVLPFAGRMRPVLDGLGRAGVPS
ncbi:hypothetical protein [Actinoplanes sp. NPDC020271]